MTTQTCAHSGCCWSVCAVTLILWWIVTSGLLWLTWNRVIGALAKVKTVKFWQALLFVATLAALAAPRFYLAKKQGGHHCGKESCSVTSSCCVHGKNCGSGKECAGKECEGDCEGKLKKGDCPYAKKHQNSQNSTMNTGANSSASEASEGSSN